MGDKRRANVKRDGRRKAVTIGIYSIKHKALYDMFYDENGNLVDGRKPASDIPRMCSEYLSGDQRDGITEILLRIEDKISNLKGISAEVDEEIDALDGHIDDFLEMTDFME